MKSVSSINNQSLLQFTLIVAIVFGIGWFKRVNANNRDKNDKTANSALCINKPSTEFENSYPEEFFKSEDIWQKYKSDNLKGCVLYKGEGKLNKSKIEIEFILRPNGTLVGRYHNSNGTNLDLNGFVETKTSGLNFNLGHASTKTLSNMHLNFEGICDDNSSYLYNGVWGKKNLPVSLVIKQNDELNNE